MTETEQLVKRVRSGDTEAFGRLVERYERVAVATAAAIVQDFHHAQDVVQESFVKAFRSIHQLNADGAFGPWLLVIVRRKAQRLAQRQPDCLSTLPKQEPDRRESESATPWNVLLPLLDRLPDHELEVISLRYLNGYSVRQICQITRRPTGTVTKQISRAVQRLQEMTTEVDV